MTYDELRELVIQLGAIGCHYNPTDYRAEVAVSLNFSHLLDALTPKLPRSVRELLGDDDWGDLGEEAKEAVSAIVDVTMRAIAKGLYRLWDSLAAYIADCDVDRDDCVLCVLVDDLPDMIDAYMALFTVVEDEVRVYYIGRDKRLVIPIEGEEEEG